MGSVEKDSVTAVGDCEDWRCCLGALMVKVGVGSIKEDPLSCVEHSSTEETEDDAEAVEAETETVEAKVDCTGGCFLQNLP